MADIREPCGHVQIPSPPGKSTDHSPSSTIPTKCLRQVPVALLRRALATLLRLGQLRKLDAELIEIGVVLGVVVIELAHLRAEARHCIPIDLDLRLGGLGE